MTKIHKTFITSIFTTGLLFYSSLWSTPSIHVDIKKPSSIKYHKVIGRIIKCESNGQHIWSTVDFNPPSFGLGQFKQSTFYMLSKQAGFQSTNWYSKRDQIEVLEWAVENNKLSHWKSSKHCWGV